MVIEEGFLDLSPSTKLVLNYLKEAKISDIDSIIRNTGLSRRALMYSIKTLRNRGMIDTQICLSDTRRRYYCIRISSHVNAEKE
ncbi:MAG: MarR family transcriptional regulator [Thermoplasmata archaeon]